MSRMNQGGLPNTQRVASIALAWAATFAGATAWGQLPVTRLNTAFPPGAKQGTTVDVTLTGVDLEDASRLHFSHPGLTAKPKTRDPQPWENGPQTAENEFQISVAGDVPPGVYELRAVGRYGVSNPRAFVVGNTTEMLEVDGGAEADKAQELTLPVVVNGRSNGNSDLDFYKFNLKKGQRLIVDCWAQRIDSRLDGTLVLYDPQGQEVDRDRDTNYRDPLIDHTAAADGMYTLKVYDFLYQGGPDQFYRLAIGELPYLDFVLPPAGMPGTSGEFVVYGRNLPGGQPAEGVAVDGKPLQKLAVKIDVPGGDAQWQLKPGTLAKPAEMELDGFHYRVNGPNGASNPVFIGFAQAPVVAEQEPNNDENQPRKLTLPCEVFGQFWPARDKDVFSFEAKKGDVWILEVASQRMGLITDPLLRLQQVTPNKEGPPTVRDLQSVDDLNTNIGGGDFNTKTDDPTYRFTAPADGEYRIIVRDLYSGSRGDPRYVYRLAVRPESPDFRLVALSTSPRQQRNQNSTQWSPLLRRGGTEVLDLLLFRRDGFNGEVAVTVDGLPAGVVSSPTVIGPNMTTASLVLTAAEDAADWTGEIQIVGRAKVGDRELARAARGGAIVWPGQNNQTGTESRMMRNVLLSVTAAEKAPFLVKLDADKPLEMCRNGKLEVPIKVVRRDDFKGAIALSAMTLPQNLQAPNVTISPDKTDGVLQINLQNNVNLGTYTICMQGQSQTQYQRNVEGAKAAAEVKKAVDEKVKQLDEANKKALADKAAADKLATEKAAAVKAAETARQAADKALAAAQQAQQKAEAAFNAAKSAADQEQADEAKAKARDEAQKALTEAADKLKAEQEKTAAAVKALEDAQAQAKSAVDAQKPAADQAAQAADMLKKAQDAQKVVAKRASDMDAASKPKNTNVFDPSTSITLTITASPVVASPQGELKVKQGEKVELPVKIERKYGFDDEVSLEINFPGGVNGLKAAKLTLKKGETEGKFTLEAASNASVGSHTVTLRNVSRFNNQTIQADDPLPLVVEAVQK